MFKQILGGLHRKFGRTSYGLAFAFKLKNQMMAIIRSSLNDGIEMESNGEQWLLDVIAPSARCFFDVGANVGNWTQAFLNARDNEQVLGMLFEPAPGTYRILSKSMSGLIDKRVLKIYEKAVSDELGEISFYEEQGYGETSSFVKEHSGNNANLVTVKTTTIDTVVAEENITYIDMLKIDAEGYDLHVLKGALNSIKSGLIGTIQFEYNAPWAYAGGTLYEALSLLQRYGYRTFILMHDGLRQFDYDVYGEYYGYSNFIALSPKAYMQHKQAFVLC